VRIAMEQSELVVTVLDDGVGGVDIGSGSGLRGLQDRLAAVDGRLHIDSPAGQGTRLTARIPVVSPDGDGQPAAGAQA